MNETTARPGRARTIIIVIVAFVVAGVVIGVTYLTGGGTALPGAAPTSSATPHADTTPPPGNDLEDEGEDMQQLPTPSSLLPEPMGGQEAIDALGDKIEIVAARNGKTVEQLKDLLLRDKTAQVSTSGFIRYVDTFENEG